MPDVSAAIMNTKLDDLVSTGAELVVGVDLGCLLHLEGGLRRRGSDMRVAHLAEVLAGEV
jgi:L-lactate dehydrogenase complex protein LldE